MSLICIQNYLPIQATASLNSEFDPYWANVVLAMPMDSPDGTANFFDLKGHTVSKVGTVSYAADGKFGGAYFGVASKTGHLTVGQSTDFTLDGDFTIEAFINCGQIGDACYIYGVQNATAWMEIDRNSGKLAFKMNGGNFSLFSASILSVNTWYHVAVCRKSGLVKMFIDGILVGSLSNAYSSYSIPGDIQYIGTDYGGSPGARFFGKIDDFRITKGVARYANDFAVPSKAIGDWHSTDYYWDNTTLLMHMDGVDNSTFSDEKGHALTTYGTAKLSSASSKFGGISGKFDGTTCRVSAANSADFNFGTGDFTVEFWVNMQGSANAQGIVGQKLNDSSSGWVIYHNTTNFPNKLGARLGGTVDFHTNRNFVIGTWEHYALTRSGSTVRWFVNGVLTNTGTNSTNLTDATAGLWVGRTQTWDGPLNGYLDDLRITKGIARYTQSFSVPTKAFDDNATITYDPYWAQTVLALHMDGSDGSTAIIDGTGKTITTGTNVYISTAQSKFGGSSLWIKDSTSTGSTIQPTQDLVFGTGEFTIEFWFNSSDTSGYIYSPDSVDNNSFGIFVLGSSLYFRVGGNTTVISSNISAYLNNTWHHAAFVRSAGTLKLYIDGVAVASAANATNFSTLSTWRIGHALASGAYGPFVGYLDDFRITRAARYLGTFTPPTQAFKDQ